VKIQLARAFSVQPSAVEKTSPRNAEKLQTKDLSAVSLTR